MKKHLRSLHDDAMFRAEYYRWAAARGQAIAGNDPVTGSSRSSMGAAHREEGRVAYIAMARYWVGRARQIRQQAAAR